VLAPDDRKVLLDLLRPPPDMRLDMAVATTFTLDLEAALVIPLAFTPLETNAAGDPIAVLEAIRSITDRFTVFCQAGEMRLPAAASDLFTFLGPIVHEVKRPRPGHLFHPKLWLLRYLSDDALGALRLVVASRNLTNDAGWDAVVHFDAEIGTSRDPDNKPLVDLLGWCRDNTTRAMTDQRRDALDRLAQDVWRADWWAAEDAPHFEFHVLGVSNRTPGPDFTGHRHLVISPFVTDDGIDLVAPSSNRTVISRPAELDKLTPATLASFAYRTISSLDAVEDGVAPTLGDLHAKIVIVEQAKKTRTFVGSANATGAAFNGNIEVLVELIGPRKLIGIDAALEGMGPLLEDCALTGGATPSAADELQRQLDDLLRAAAEVDNVITPHLDDDGAYRVIVQTEPLLPDLQGIGGSLELLSRPGHAITLDPGVGMYESFTGVPLADITPFLVLRIELAGPPRTAGAAVLRAHLHHDVPGRFDAVIARQVDTPEKFLRFVYLLLGLSAPAAQANGGSGDDGSFGAWLGTGSTSLFESLVRALATNPAALDGLASLVERLLATEEGRAILPNGFEDLWASVMQAKALVG